MASTLVIILSTRHIIVIVLLLAKIVCIQVVLKQGCVSIHWTQLYSYCGQVIAFILLQ